MLRRSLSDSIPAPDRSSFIMILERLLRCTGSKIDTVYLTHRRLPSRYSLLVYIMTLIRYNLAVSWIYLRSSARPLRAHVVPFHVVMRALASGNVLSGVYCARHLSGRGEYYGQSTDLFRRILKDHCRHLREQPDQIAPESHFHAVLRAEGMRNIVFVFLLCYPRPDEAGLRQLSEASCRATEAWFIRTFAWRNARTWNTVGTWRNLHGPASLVSADRLRGYRRRQRHPALRWLDPSAVSHSRRTFRRYRVGSMYVHDFNVVLRFLVASGSAGDALLPLRIEAIHGEVDVTDWSTMRDQFGNSVFQVCRDSGNRTIMASSCTRATLRDAAAITVVTAVRSVHYLSLADRRSLARLSWDPRARAHASQRDFHWFVFMFRRARRHPRRALERQSTVARLCCSAHGMHPRLRLLCGINTPLVYDRQQLRKISLAIIDQYSGLHGVALHTVRREFRIVFRVAHKLADLLRNDYKASADYRAGGLRSCCCQTPGMYAMLPGAWRDDDG